MTLEDLKTGLSRDELMLARYLETEAIILNGGTVKNATLAGVRSAIAGVRACIVNKKRLIAERS